MLMEGVMTFERSQAELGLPKYVGQADVRGSNKTAFYLQLRLSPEFGAPC